MAAKSAENAARIAAVLHVIESGPTGEISNEIMVAGIKIAFWFLEQTKRALGLVEVSEEERLGRLLFEWLRRQGRPAWIKDIQRLGPYQVRRSAKVRDSAIDWGVDSGHARKIGIGGRTYVEAVR